MSSPALPDYLDVRLDWRPMTPADIDNWHALIRRMAEVDKPVWFETRADLEEAFESAANDPAATTLMGTDADGTARAVGKVRANTGSATAYAWGGVDPRWRRRGIGRAVYRWQEECQRRRFLAAGISGGVLRTYTEERDLAHNALMGTVGAKVVRYFTEMTRPLADPIPDLPLPDGYVFATLDPDQSEAVRSAHNEAFADHWGYVGEPFENFLHRHAHRTAAAPHAQDQVWPIAALQHLPVEGGDPGDGDLDRECAVLCRRARELAGRRVERHAVRQRAREAPHHRAGQAGSAPPGAWGAPAVRLRRDLRVTRPSRRG